VSLVHGASVVVVVDSVLPDPALAVTPNGKTGYKNAGTIALGESGTRGSNPDDRSAARSNRRSEVLGAGPRAASARQLTVRAGVLGGVVDSADAVPAAAAAPWGSRDSADWTWRDANAWPPHDKHYCNSGFGGDMA